MDQIQEGEEKIFKIYREFSVAGYADNWIAECASSQLYNPRESLPCCLAAKSDPRFALNFDPPC